MASSSAARSSASSHRDSMGAQLRRLVHGYELLAQTVPAAIPELASSLNPEDAP